MITKMDMFNAALKAGIRPEVAEKLITGAGVVVHENSPRVVLRLVLDDGDTFHAEGRTIIAARDFQACMENAQDFDYEPAEGYDREPI